MLLLSVANLTRQFDADPVLDAVSFEVRAGEKIGLVGPNGAGKTTLFRVLAGLDEPDAGQCAIHPATRVAILEQAADFSLERSLLDEARMGLAPLYALQREAEEVAARIGAERDPAAHDKLQKRYDFMQHELHRLNAYNIDHRVDEVLSGLGFQRDEYQRSISQFSGGQQNRVLLARLLLASPDLMLLDEPTNHLDIAATEWLEGYLAQSDSALLVVSHDRYFLDKVTERTLELFRGRVTDYPGNFSAYWRLKAQRDEVLERTSARQQAFVERTEDFIRRNHYGQKHAQAHDREKKLERLERVERPREIVAPSMAFGAARRTGDWVIDASGLSKGFGTPLFRDVTLRVLRGDRLGIFGPNGCGKTTLLRTLLGDLPCDEGSVRLGANVEIAYFDQQLANIDPELVVVEAVRPANDPTMTPARIRELLARFGLKGDIVRQKVGSLSGGEKSRSALARVAALAANVLVLDEPTNHLDLWSRAALEESLREFEGTLLFVSHDRYFLDRLATRVFAFEPERWRLYDGNYSQYLDSLARAAANSAGPDARDTPRGQPRQPLANRVGSGSQATEPRRKRRFPYRKVHDIEIEIAEAEDRLQQLEADLASPELYRNGDRVRTTKEEFQHLHERLTQLYAHWEEAAELN